MWNAKLDEAQAGIKTARRYINNLRYADDTTLMAESKEKLKILLMKVKEESEKVMYGCESWTVKKAEHQRTDAFELWCWRRLLRVPWTARRSNQSILEKNQSWIFIGRTDAEAEAPILWLPDVKNWLIGKDPDAGKDWRQEEKGMTENDKVR